MNPAAFLESVHRSFETTTPTPGSWGVTRCILASSRSGVPRTGGALGTVPSAVIDPFLGRSAPKQTRTRVEAPVGRSACISAAARAGSLLLSASRGIAHHRRHGALDLRAERHHRGIRVGVL